MLEEGQRLASAGADVVVGFVEPHGRRPTAALAQGRRSRASRRSCWVRAAAAGCPPSSTAEWGTGRSSAPTSSTYSS
ncbi:hypothetical protein [Streptomyces sp. NPDC041003]